MTALEYILSLPKTIRFNLKYLPWRQAIKLPIFVSKYTLFKKLGGKITINGPIKTGMIKIGFTYVGITDKKYSRTILEIYGNIEFENKAFIGAGSRVNVGERGHLFFGDNFMNSAQMTIICQKEVIFENNILFSWDTMVIDTDFHHTIDPHTCEISKSYEAPIYIQSNVWIGARSVILKGTIIPKGCIIGCNSVLNKPYNIGPNCLLAGNPAILKKQNITLYTDEYSNTK